MLFGKRGEGAGFWKGCSNMRAAWLSIHLYCTQVFDKESFLVLCLPPENFLRNPGEKMHMQAYYRNEKVIVAE